MNSMDDSCTVSYDKLLALRPAIRCLNTNSTLVLMCCFTSDLGPDVQFYAAAFPS